LEKKGVTEGLRKKGVGHAPREEARVVKEEAAY